MMLSQIGDMVAECKEVVRAGGMSIISRLGKA